MFVSDFRHVWIGIVINVVPAWQISIRTWASCSICGEHLVRHHFSITIGNPRRAPWINMDRPGIISVGWIMYLCVRLPVVERLRTRVHTAIDACHHSGWLTGRFRLKNQSVVWNINFRRQVLICQQVSLNICIRWTIWISTNATWVFFTKNYTIWFCLNIFFFNSFW